MAAGIYLHVPFCRQKCGYCDFYSLPKLSWIPAYLETVKQEILSYRDQGIVADTLYFGGGTPSLLPPEEIGALIGLCRDVFSLEGEITLEANPESSSLSFLRKIKAAGVNRISFGAQSIIPKELAALGRIHTAKAIDDAVFAAREAGFSNISLDVMLAIPYQTEKSLQQTLSHFISLQPTHLSAYLLKIEEGTPFFQNHIERLCPDDDYAASLYLQTVAALNQAGLLQYEISNFAKPGMESRHNLKYWIGEEYIGIGPAAHSAYKGKRFFHPSSLAQYIRSQGKNLLLEGDFGGEWEQLMLSLRLTKGVDPDTFSFGQSLKEKADSYLRAGWMAKRDGKLAFTPQGFLLSNSILAQLLPDEE